MIIGISFKHKTDSYFFFFFSIIIIIIMAFMYWVIINYKSKKAESSAIVRKNETTPKLIFEILKIHYPIIFHWRLKIIKLITIIIRESFNAVIFFSVLIFSSELKKYVILWSLYEKKNLTTGWGWAGTVQRKTIIIAEMNIKIFAHWSSCNKRFSS